MTVVLLLVAIPSALVIALWWPCLAGRHYMSTWYSECDGDRGDCLLCGKAWRKMSLQEQHLARKP